MTQDQPPVRVTNGPLRTSIAAELSDRGLDVLRMEPDPLIRSPHRESERLKHRPDVVVTERYDGRLSLDSVALELARARSVIVIGGPANFALLAASLELGATWAIDTTLPFLYLIDRVEFGLRGSQRPNRTRGNNHAQTLRRRASNGARFANLTDRECAVLVELALGRSVTDIARNRPVSVATVRSQVAALLSKLNVPSLQAAVALTFDSCHDRRILDALRHHQIYG